MTKKQRSITHGSFTIERTYPNATPARVFEAFKPEGKTKWFGGPEFVDLERKNDFRVGGKEIAAGRHKSGVVSRFESHYYDIIENERLIYSYEMHLDDTKISVSLATISFVAEGTSTTLTMHEDGAYLDGFDGAAGRKEGSIGLLEALAAHLAK